MTQRTFQVRRRQQRPRSPWAALLIPFLAIVITGGLFYFLATTLGGGTVVPTPLPVPPTSTPTEAAPAPTPTPEPPTATPEPTAVPVVETPTPAPGVAVLRVGGQAKVNAGGGLRVRGGPGTSFDAVTTLAPGVVVKIIGGPERADSYTWWQIQFTGADGSSGQGWVAGDFLEASAG